MQYLKVLDSYGNPIHASALASDYEGAATGRRMSTWGTSTSGPNATLFSNSRTLRSRSRELIRNNPLVDGGVDTFVANLIGSGIFPRWHLDDAKLKKTVQELWSDWVEEADFYELCDFYGLQALVSRGLIDAGEVLVRFKVRPPHEDLAVPLQLQVLEADHLDETFNSVNPQTGNEIRMGIEVDKEGRRVAYHLWPEHPGETYFYRSSFDRVRVSADEIIHVFRPLRPGQMRGRPWLTSIIVKLHELDQYEDAELVRKKTAAMFGGFITDYVPAGVDPTAYLGRNAGKDANSAPVIALEPGTFPQLPKGKDVKFSQPVDVGQTYEVWIKQQLREIAAGWGITYEQMTGDLSGVNYSSIRAGLLEFRRRCAQLQTQTISFQMCRPTARKWLDLAALKGAISIRDYLQNKRQYRRITWRPDGWPWVDPVKDQLADQMSVRNGFESRAQVIARRGGDIETVDREQAEDNDRADKLGLVYDSDPRHTTASGSIQSATEQVIKQSSQTE